MSMVYCYECESKISSYAKVCPYCGITIDKELLLIDVPKKIQIISQDFEDFLPISIEQENCITSIFNTFEKANTACPHITDFIKEISSTGKKYEADISREYQRMLKTGELKLMISGKGEVCPTLIKDGKIFKQIKLKEVINYPDLSNSITNIQTQMALAEIAREVKEVHDYLIDFRDEIDEDRVALADSVFMQLRQCSYIKDNQLRVQKLLDITSRATDVKCRFIRQIELRTNIILAVKDKRKKMSLSQCRRKTSEIFTLLANLTKVVHTEVMSYNMLGEPASAKECLVELRKFILKNKFDDKDEILKIYEYSNNKRDYQPLLEKFNNLSKDILEICSGSDTKTLQIGA